MRRNSTAIKPADACWRVLRSIKRSLSRINTAATSPTHGRLLEGRLRERSSLMYLAERIESIVGCLGTQHDLRLVVLAALICLFSCFTASGLIQRTGEATSDRAWPWLAAAVGVFSCGVWGPP